MVSGAFAVALSWMCITIRCPIIQLPLPEVHNKLHLMQDSHAATSCASGSKFRGLAGALRATTGTSLHSNACLSVNALGGRGPL